MGLLSSALSSSLGTGAFPGAGAKDSQRRFLRVPAKTRHLAGIAV